jgi:hypothetical protein
VKRKSKFENQCCAALRCAVASNAAHSTTHLGGNDITRSDILALGAFLQRFSSHGCCCSCHFELLLMLVEWI